MKRFKNILCVVEPDEACMSVLERAVTLAENNQTSLSVVMGMPEGSSSSAKFQTMMTSACEEKLAALVEPYQQRINIQTNLFTDVSFLEIICNVLRNSYDLVIKTPETADWLNRLFGSNDMHLLRKCPCPVWLIKPESPKSYQRILAAVDVDDNYPPAELKTRHLMNMQILQMAGSLALSESAELHLVHAWHAAGESTMRGSLMRMPEEEIIAYTEQIRGQHTDSLNTLLHDVAGDQGRDMLDYLKPHIHLVKGWARKEIPALAKQIKADLIIMGTVARTGIPGFIMGNTAETILNQIDCSVLAIKPPGFVTPVVLKG